LICRSRIDLSSLLFFVGILLAVATLGHAKILEALAGWLNRTVGRQDVIVLLLGILSAAKLRAMIGRTSGPHHDAVAVGMLNAGALQSYHAQPGGVVGFLASGGITIPPVVHPHPARLRRPVVLSPHRSARTP
jgi:hypothetical protein